MKRNIYSKNKRSDNLFHPSIDLWYIKQITNIKSLQFVFKEIGVKKSEFRTRLQFQFAFFIYIYIAHIYLKDIDYKAQQRQGFNARKVIPEVYASFALQRTEIFWSQEIMWIIYTPRILNEHWCIFSCWQIPPRENWFQ